MLRARRDPPPHAIREGCAGGCPWLTGDMSRVTMGHPRRTRCQGAEMADRFDVMIERVLSHEGGYVNHPRDPGGETIWGITIGVARENGYAGPMQRMPRTEAIRIYRRAFWDRVSADQIPAAVVFQVFDAAVNHGIGNAVRWMQQVVKVADDGRVGPVTLRAVKGYDQADFVLQFNAVRLRFYTKLSTFATFGRGWTNRVAGNLDYAARDN